eukprot:666289-Rhodomonas_salina.2
MCYAPLSQVLPSHSPTRVLVLPVCYQCATSVLPVCYMLLPFCCKCAMSGGGWRVLSLGACWGAVAGAAAGRL